MSYFIKIPKLELNIWGWIGRKIGDTLNANQKKEMDEIRGDIRKLTTDFENYKKEDEARNMNLKRQRILQFSDEIRRKERHSEESFNDVLADMDAYDAYCKAHPGYQNSRAKFAMENIARVYKHELETDGFLKD